MMDRKQEIQASYKQLGEFGSFYDNIPLWDDEKESLWMLPGYMEGIREAGGIPIMLPLTADEEELKQLMDMTDGILFTGGHDVSPSLYGETPLNEGVICCLLHSFLKMTPFWFIKVAFKKVEAMTTSDVIRILCKKQNISVAELGRPVLWRSVRKICSREFR